MKFNFVVFLATVCVNYLNANNTAHKNYNIQSSSLIVLFDSIFKAQSDEQRLKIGSVFTAEFNKELQCPESYTFNFDTLSKVGKIKSPDNVFKIYTWNVPLSDNTYKFYGIIQFNPANGASWPTYILTDNANSSNLLDVKLNSNNWLGALYYDIIPQKINKTVVYTLLGLRLNNMFSTQKIIESLYFSESGTPVFGMPHYSYENKIRSRIIFEYSVYVSMVLNYNYSMKMIVFDHLSPDQPIHTGDYKYYGPDFTYDALNFEKNKWVFIPNVKVNNPKDIREKKHKIVYTHSPN